MVEAMGLEPIYAGLKGRCTTAMPNLQKHIFQLKLERPARIELASPAWKAGTLPIGQGRKKLVGVAGFEPANAGFKIRCLKPLGYTPIKMAVHSGCLKLIYANEPCFTLKKLEHETGFKPVFSEVAVPCIITLPLVRIGAQRGTRTPTPFGAHLQCGAFSSMRICAFYLCNIGSLMWHRTTLQLVNSQLAHLARPRELTRSFEK